MPDRAKDLPGKPINRLGVAPVRRTATPRSFAALALGTAAAAGVGFSLPTAVCAAPPQPIILLYPSSVDDNSAYKQLIDVRTKLRADGQFLVISYDPDAPSIIRAANDSNHPEWLTSEPKADLDQLAFARAIGASFYAVISANGRKAVVHLVETGTAHRMWDITDKAAKDAASSLEDQASYAVAHPAETTDLVPIGPIPNVRPEAPPVLTTPVTATPPPVVAAPPLTPPVVVVPPVTPAPPALVTPPVAPAAPPVVTPTPVVTTPAAPPDTTQTDVAAPAADDSASDTAAIAQADEDVSHGDIASAIAIYKQAINASPMEVSPRLHLAKAYLAGGLRDMALDEAKRALVLDPTNVPVQQFLLRIDEQSGNSDGAITRNQALVERNPNDSAAHIGLGDAFWNNNDIVSAEKEYKLAAHLAPAGDVTAIGHLARLYAAGGRYTDSLKTLTDAGSGLDVYAIALQIIQGRADALSAKLDTAKDAFQAGDSTREAFYDAAKSASSEANELSDFANAITPPKAFEVSHLHRIQGVDLLAQEAAIYVSFIETSNADDGQRATDLEKSSQTEMLTAHAIEARAGLWKDRD